MTQLERAVKQKDMEIADLNLELSTLRKIQRAHVKTILTNEDDFHKNEVILSVPQPHPLDPR